jgi:hypothetical protein
MMNGTQQTNSNFPKKIKPSSLLDALESMSTNKAALKERDEVFTHNASIWKTSNF